MFRSLDNALGDIGRRAPLGGLLIGIEDRSQHLSSTNAFRVRPRSDSTFLLLHLLRAYLDSGRRCLLVSCLQPVSHYRIAGAKNGLRLQAALDDGRLQVVEPGQWQMDGSGSGSLIAQLFERIQDDDSPTVILLADLDILTGCGWSFDAIARVTQAARSMTANGACVCTLSSFDEQKSKRLAAFIAHCSHLSVETIAFSSGYAAEYDGEMRVRREDEEEKRFLYKVHERRVDVTALAESG